MLKFLGFELELFVDEILDQDSVVRSAQDFRGGHWLIIEVAQDPERLVWVCAPISVRALHEVVTGRAKPSDAVRHSATGTVELVTVERGRAVPDRCLCCASIPEHLLTGIDRLLIAA